MEYRDEWQEISSIMDEIAHSTRKLQDVQKTLTGAYIQERADEWVGEFSGKGAKYSSTGKTHQQVAAIRKASDLSDVENAQTELDHIVHEFEKAGYEVLARIEKKAAGLQNLALQITPKGESNFFEEGGRGTNLGIKPQIVYVPIDKNGRIYYDGLERDNIVYPTANKHGNVKNYSSIETGLRRILEQFYYGSNAAIISRGSVAGASADEIKQAYRVIERITNKQMRSAIMPASAMSPYNADILSELRKSFDLTGSAYREGVIESSAYLDHMFDAILKEHVKRDYGESKESFDKKRNSYLQKISKISLIIRARGVEAGLREIRSSSEYTDFLTSPLGNPTLRAISELADMGTVMGPVSDANGLTLTYMRGLDRAWQFLLPASSRKSYQVELNTMDFAKVTRDFAHTKGAIIRTAWEKQHIGAEKLSGKAYDTTRLLPVSQEQLARAIKLQHDAVATGKDKSRTLEDIEGNQFLSVLGDAMVLDTDSFRERFGYETITKRISNDLIIQEYNALIEQSKKSDRKLSIEDKRRLAKKAVMNAMKTMHGEHYQAREDLLTFGGGDQKKQTELDSFLQTYFKVKPKYGKFDFSKSLEDTAEFGIRKLAKLDPDSLALNLKWVTPGAEVRVAGQTVKLSSLLPYLAQVLGVDVAQLEGVQGLIEAKQYSAKNLVTPLSALVNDVFGTYQKKYRKEHPQEPEGAEYGAFVKALREYLPEGDSDIEQVITGLFGLSDVEDNMKSEGQFTAGFLQTNSKKVQDKIKKYSPLLLQALGYLETGGKSGLLTPQLEGADFAVSSKALENQQDLLEAIRSGKGKDLAYKINAHPFALTLARHAGATYGAAGSHGGYPASYGYRELAAIRAQISYNTLLGNRVSALGQYYRDLGDLTEVSRDEYQNLLNYAKQASQMTWSFDETQHDAERIRKNKGLIFDISEFNEDSLAHSLDDIRDQNDTQLFNSDDFMNRTILGQIQTRQREHWDTLSKEDQKKLLLQAGGEAAVQSLIKSLSDKRRPMSPEELAKLRADVERRLGASMIPYYITSTDEATTGKSYLFTAIDPNNPDSHLASQVIGGAHIGASARLNALGKEVLDAGPNANAIENTYRALLAHNKGTADYGTDQDASRILGQKLFSMHAGVMQDLTQHGFSTFEKSQSIPLAHSMMPTTFSLDLGEDASTIANALVISQADLRELLKPTDKEKEILKSSKRLWSDWLGNYYVDMLGATGKESLEKLKQNLKTTLEQTKGWSGLSDEKKGSIYEGRLRGLLESYLVKGATIGTKEFEETGGRGLQILMNRYPSIAGRTDVRTARVLAHPKWKDRGSVGGDEALLELFNADYDGDHIVLSLLAADEKVYARNKKLTQEQALAEGRNLLLEQSKETAIARYLNSLAGIDQYASIKAGATEADQEQESKDIYTTKYGKSKVGAFSYLRQGFLNRFYDSGFLGNTSRGNSDSYLRQLLAEGWNHLWMIPEQKTISAKKSETGEVDREWYHAVDRMYETLKNPMTLQDPGLWHNALNQMEELGWLQSGAPSASQLDASDMAQMRSISAFSSLVGRLAASADTKAKKKALQKSFNTVFGDKALSVEDLSQIKFKVGANGLAESIDLEHTPERAIEALKKVQLTRETFEKFRTLMSQYVDMGAFGPDIRETGDLIRKRYDVIPGMEYVNGKGVLYNKERKVYSDEAIAAFKSMGLTVTEDKTGLEETERLHEIYRDMVMAQEAQNKGLEMYAAIGSTLTDPQEQAKALLKGPEWKSIPIMPGGYGTSATRLSLGMFKRFQSPVVPDYLEFVKKYKGQSLLKYETAEDLDVMFKNFQTLEGGNLAHTIAQTMLGAAQKGYTPIQAGGSSSARVQSFIKEMEGLPAAKEFVEQMRQGERSVTNPEGEVGLIKALEEYKKLSEVLNPYGMSRATPIQNLESLGATFATAYTDYLGITGDANAQQQQLGTSEAVLIGELNKSPMYARADQISYALVDELLPGAQGAKRLNALRQKALGLDRTKSLDRWQKASALQIREWAEKQLGHQRVGEKRRVDLNELIEESNAAVSQKRLRTFIGDFKTTSGDVKGLSPENVVQGIVLQAVAQGLQETLRKSHLADNFLDKLHSTVSESGGHEQAYKDLLRQDSELSKALEQDLDTMLAPFENGTEDIGDESDASVFLRSLSNQYSGLSREERVAKMRETLKALLIGAEGGGVDVTFFKGSTNKRVQGVRAFHLKSMGAQIRDSIIGKLAEKNEDLTSFELQALDRAFEDPTATTFSQDAPSAEYDAFEGAISEYTDRFKKYHKLQDASEAAKASGDTAEAEKLKGQADDEMLGALNTDGVRTGENSLSELRSRLRSQWGTMSETDKEQFLKNYGLEGADQGAFEKILKIAQYEALNKSKGTAANAKKWRKAKEELDQYRRIQRELQTKLSVSKPDSKESELISSELGEVGRVIQYLENNVDVYSEYFKTPKRKNGQYVFAENGDMEFDFTAPLVREKLQYEQSSKASEEEAQRSYVEEYESLQMQRATLRGERSYLRTIQQDESQHLSQAEQQEIQSRLKEIDETLHDHVTGRLKELQSLLLQGKKGRAVTKVKAEMGRWQDASAAEEKKLKASQESRAKAASITREQELYGDALRKYSALRDAELDLDRNAQEIERAKDPTQQRILGLERERLEVSKQLAEANVQTMESEHNAITDQAYRSYVLGVQDKAKGAADVAALGQQEAYQRMLAGSPQDFVGKTTSGFGSLLKGFSSGYGLFTIIQKITQSISKLVTQAKELDVTLTNLRIVTGDSKSSTRGLIAEYSELARSLGATTTEVSSSAVEWLRQGYSTSEAMDLVTSSLYLSTLGMLDTATATKDLTFLCYNTLN